jgi:hypothetical protein
LATGRPLEIQEIAGASAKRVEEVQLALDSGRCERDSRGRLIDLYGLTLTPTLHRLETNGRVLYSCCALWAHVIPKLLDCTVRVESVDPQTRQIVRLSISPAAIESVEPGEGAATLATARRESVEADVCQAFCCHVRHFISSDSAEAFAHESTARHAVSLADLEEAAELLYSSIWSRAGQDTRPSSTFSHV